MNNTLRTLGTLAALTASASVSAHTGHGTETLFTGLAHPLGLDHLLAMVAVGVWSAAALPIGQRITGPATFMAALLAGALAGAAGLVLSGTEALIALSVVVFGAMLAFAQRIPARGGLVLVGLAALMHGLAHGAELPAGGGFVGYALGFLATTALLHSAGLGLGHAMLRLHGVAWRLLGTGVGVTGLVLLTRV